MPFYQQRGQVPHKRHTQFAKPDGTLHHEQLFGTIGFVGMSSLLYHLYPPTMVREVSSPVDMRPTEGRKRKHHFETGSRFSSPLFGSRLGCARADDVQF